MYFILGKGIKDDNLSMQAPLLTDFLVCTNKVSEYKLSLGVCLTLFNALLIFIYFISGAISMIY